MSQWLKVEMKYALYVDSLIKLRENFVKGSYLINISTDIWRWLEQNNKSLYGL